MKQRKYRSIDLQHAFELYERGIEIHVRNEITGSLVPVYFTATGTFTDNIVKASGHREHPKLFIRVPVVRDFDKPQIGWLAVKYGVIRVMQGEPVCRCPRCNQTYIVGVDLMSHYIPTQEYMVKLLCIQCREKINAKEKT